MTPAVAAARVEFSDVRLDFPELRDDLPQVLDAMRDQGVTHALCIAVEMDKWPVVHAIARAHPNLYASVGVHPDYADIEEPIYLHLPASPGVEVRPAGVVVP